ncbi:MAG TPA: 5-formyltetrahydrofolate cyclo-ligase [Casimicrobiaceae bacterium]|jgi:5-formyltetrahydrofolate cyclo-ligase|nr:5-formyltetrahydrofolate cyclo-ligase [Casimicrobiaceae bacterium]
MRNADSEAEEALRSAKKSLRASVIAGRDELDTEKRRRDSQAITAKLLALPAYRAAGVVCAYASFGSEFDTAAFCSDVIAAGKRLLLPRINRAARMLELREVKNLGDDLVAGVWGICEPAERCPIVRSSAVEFLLVPGVAFTATGERLGYGGGFYDRLLSGLNAKTPRVAAAFALQLVDSIPTGPNDQRVHLVVTEGRKSRDEGGRMKGNG